jgi:hypothetical protein
MCRGDQFNDAVFYFFLDLPTQHLQRAIGKKMVRANEGEGKRMPKRFVIACAAVFLLCVVGLIDKAPTVQTQQSRKMGRP